MPKSRDEDTVGMSAEPERAAKQAQKCSAELKSESSSCFEEWTSTVSSWVPLSHAHHRATGCISWDCLRKLFPILFCCGYCHSILLSHGTQWISYLHITSMEKKKKVFQIILCLVCYLYFITKFTNACWKKKLTKTLGTWLSRAYRLVVVFGIAFTKPQTLNSD